MVNLARAKQRVRTHVTLDSDGKDFPVSFAFALLKSPPSNWRVGFNMCAILDFELNLMREIQDIFITVRSKIDSKHSSARYAEAARIRSLCTTRPSRNFLGADSDGPNIAQVVFGEILQK
jgi:hypothetical protein